MTVPSFPPGFLEETRRISYLEGHLRALREAIDAGVDVRGDFTWSLTDNVEWIEGAGKRLAWSTSTTRHCAGRPRTRTPGTAS